LKELREKEKWEVRKKGERFWRLSPFFIVPLWINQPTPA
jgi:hypothetical protein